MKIGLLLEGLTDEEPVKILVRKICNALNENPSIEIRKLKGHGDLLNQRKVEAITERC